MNNYDWAEPPSQTAFPIASAGYPLIFASAFTTVVLAVLGLGGPALGALLVTFCICLFFRDPDRVIPVVAGAAVSPADGKVIFAGTVDVNPYFQGPCLKISIFMTVFNVHVNRVSYEGTVKKIDYHPGKFFRADLDKASLTNEHNAVIIQTQTGREFCIVQVAGWIARRIICHVRENDTVKRGQRFGLICFGSRLDVYLPPDFNLNVSVGEKVKAGASILGNWP
jgi:phosphatidylserine decarboxylase